jgi:hypothetical protein
MAITLNGSTGITNDGGYTGDGVVFADTTPSNTLVTTTGGNVGVGTSSPADSSSKLTVSGVSTTLLDASGSLLRFNKSAGTDTAWVSNRSYGWHNGNGLAISTQTADDLKFGTNNTERMRIDSSGNLLVGTTSAGTYAGVIASIDVVRTAASGSAAAFKNANANDQTICVWNSATSGTRYLLEFSTNSTRLGVGSINTNGTSTTYSTSSDYRLKENISPMTGALATVSALKPVTYTWKSTGEDGQGFIAHELQEIVPDCVSGEKDAVDAEGNPKYQGIDTSFLVATLTAAIQELKAELDGVKAELATFKA